MNRSALVLLALLLLALAAPAQAEIPLRWTTPALVANQWCAPDSAAHSWAMALIYYQPRKVPSVPGLLWPLQVPILVDSVGPFAPGSQAGIDMPERMIGGTYHVRSRSVAGLSCPSNPVAAWRES